MCELIKESQYCNLFDHVIIEQKVYKADQTPRQEVVFPQQVLFSIWVHGKIQLSIKKTVWSQSHRIEICCEYPFD